VGKNLTTDGSVFLAGYGDEPSSHWLELVERKQHDAKARMRVGVYKNWVGLGKNKREITGEVFFIPQVKQTARHLVVNYSAYRGFPGPLTNGGLNEHGVAARDVWSPSRRELVDMTPRRQRGLQYSDLSRIVVQRAKSAREAVKLVGALIAKHGYATYGGNSHIFADAKEGWVLIEFAGGRGLWAAKRLGPNEVRVSRPGYIGEIPLDYKTHPHYMGSDNLISFAVKRGWYDPKGKKPFNVNAVYAKQDGRMREPVVALIEDRLRKKAPQITLKDVIAALRTPEVSRDSAGYGQIAHLRDMKHTELRLLWVTLSSPVTAPFVPVHLGVDEIPAEYGWHRYLTTGEAGRFLDADHMGLESSRSAFYLYKRLYYLTCSHPKTFLPEVVLAFNAFEDRLIEALPTVEKAASRLLSARLDETARKLLTQRLALNVQQAMRLAEALADSIEQRTRVLFGFRRPAGLADSGRIHCTPKFVKQALNQKLAVPKYELPKGVGDVPKHAGAQEKKDPQKSADDKKRRKKKTSASSSATTDTPLWVTVFLFVLVIILAFVELVVRRRRRASQKTDEQNTNP
jgi:dipeptidase